MCPLLCLSVVPTILLMVYGYGSLLGTVKSQKSDCGRRYSAFRVLPVPQPDPPRGKPRRHKSGLRSRITPHKRVSDDPTDTTYHTDTSTTQYDDFDRPPAAPSAPRSLSGHSREGAERVDFVTKSAPHTSSAFQLAGLGIISIDAHHNTSAEPSRSPGYDGITSRYLLPALESISPTGV